MQVTGRRLQQGDLIHDNSTSAGDAVIGAGFLAAACVRSMYSGVDTTHGPCRPPVVLQDATEGANNDPALLALGVPVIESATSLTGAGFAAANFTSSGLAAGLFTLMEGTANQLTSSKYSNKIFLKDQVL